MFRRIECERVISRREQIGIEPKRNFLGLLRLGFGTSPFQVISPPPGPSRTAE